MEFLLKNWMLVLIMVLSGSMLIFPVLYRRSSGMKEIGNLAVTQLINREGATLIDIREARDLGERKIVGALHIPYSVLKERLDTLKLDKNKPVIVYDARGQRATIAGGTLKAAGFTQLYSLSGGFKTWAEAGLPLEKV